MFWKFWKVKPEKLHHENPVALGGNARRIDRNNRRINHVQATIAAYEQRLKTEKDRTKRRVLQKKIDFFDRELTIRSAMKEV